MALRKILILAFACSALHGCGGGDSSSGGSPISDSYVFPPGKATLAFSAISTARLPTAISGINFSLVLPPGMDVTTINGVGVSGDNDSATLASTYFVSGIYDSSNRTDSLAMITSSDNYRSGEFLRLTCTVASNTSISLGDLKRLNSPVTIIKAIGMDPSNTTVQLTDKLKITIGVVK